MLRTLLLSASVLAIIVLSAGVAAADCTSASTWPNDGSGVGYAGVGDSRQFGSWTMSRGDESVGMTVNPHADMSSLYCQQSYLDWGVTPRSHYDARIARTCRPGVTVGTDPGGNGRWEEPPSFCYSAPDDPQIICKNIGGMRSGSGVVITDNLGYVSDEDFASTTCAYTTLNDIPSQAAMYVKIRTLYENGAIKYNDGGDPTMANG